MPTFDIPGMPGAQMGMINLGEMLGKAFGRTHQDAAKLTVAQTLRAADGRGERQAARPGAGRAARRSRPPSSNGIVFLDEIDKICAREGRIGRRRQPRGRAARPAAADRGHHGLDQARRGEDRPHPVHRLAAPSTSASRPTCCPSCRAACRSASSCSRCGREDFAPHPGRARGEPDQAVRGADGDRGRDARLHRRRHRRDRRRSPPRSTSRSRTSAPGACRR